MRRYRSFLIPAAAFACGLAFLLSNLLSNVVYFRTPTQTLEIVDPTERFRLGGQVVDGSAMVTAETVVFKVTDGRETVEVRHRGAPQNLFREGIEVVLEGTWDGELFRSDSMLVKHDEQYRIEGDVGYGPPGVFDS